LTICSNCFLKSQNVQCQRRNLITLEIILEKSGYRGNGVLLSVPVSLKQDPCHTYTASLSILFLKNSFILSLYLTMSTGQFNCSSRSCLIPIKGTNSNTIKAHIKELARRGRLEMVGASKGTWYKLS